MGERGDPRLGGGDIDRLLAFRLLDKLEKAREAALLDIEGVRRALHFSSYESFRKERGDAEESKSRGLFHKAVDLLRAAERMKRALTEKDDAMVVPSLDDWPLRAADLKRALGQRVELRVSRAEAREVYAAPFSRAASLLGSVLDDAGLRYDLTSDLALARGRGPRLRDYRGIVLAGNPRFLPLPLARDLHSWVKDGGRVLSLGAESLRRYAKLDVNELSAPTAAATSL